VRGEVTAAELIDQLPIVSENVIAEAAVQSQLFIQAAAYRVERMRARAQATAELEQHRAKVGLRERARKDIEGKKPTEAATNARIELDSNTMRLRRRLDEAHTREELSKLILEAYRMRRDSIRILAEHLLYNTTREGAEVERIEENRRIRNQARSLHAKRRQIADEDDTDQSKPVKERFSTGY
jgi:hypothetical protein